MKIKTNLIIGIGEVGSAISSVLKDDDSCTWDVKYKAEFPCDRCINLHICFPYSDGFSDSVVKYISRYSPCVVIIHSTIPVGETTIIRNIVNMMGHNIAVVHSPVRGTHPNLERGLMTFVKHFGGPNAETASVIFERKGIGTSCHLLSETTEAMKLWDTTQYGLMIMIQKKIYAWCMKNGLSFDDVYTNPNVEYNEGYRNLGNRRVVRPYLKNQEGPIGGHCIIPNALMLDDSDLADLLISFNNQLINERFHDKEE